MTSFITFKGLTWWTRNKDVTELETEVVNENITTEVVNENITTEVVNDNIGTELENENAAGTLV